MTAPLVTVVLISHDQEGFVADAVGSVLRQTFRDFELVMVDDASTDGTVDVLERASCHSGNARVIRLAENMGPAAARNVGISVAAGRYVLPLDGDDMIEPEYLDVTVRAIEAGDVEVVYTDGRCFGDDTSLLWTGAWDPKVIVKKNRIPVCALMKRSALEAVGGYRPEEGMFCDWGLWVAFVMHGFRGRHIPEPLWLYRRHDAAAMRTITQDERSRLREVVLSKTRVPVGGVR